MSRAASVPSGRYRSPRCRGDSEAGQLSPSSSSGRSQLKTSSGIRGRPLKCRPIRLALPSTRRSCTSTSPPSRRGPLQHEHDLVTREEDGVALERGLGKLERGSLAQDRAHGLFPPAPELCGYEEATRGPLCSVIAVAEVTFRGRALRAAHHNAQPVIAARPTQPSRRVTLQFLWSGGGRSRAVSARRRPWRARNEVSAGQAGCAWPSNASSASVANTCRPSRSEISEHTLTPRTLLP